jgi:hypothetical protein
MKINILLVALLATVTGVRAQTCLTKNGFIGFYSKTPLEDIRAENNQVYAIIDLGKKNLAFSVLLKGFIFTKELMQEHFNENYVESDKCPKSTFTGAYTGDVFPDKDGSYQIQVKGNLNLHNVTRSIEIPATLEVSQGKLSGHASFKVRPEDFNITIPSIVRDKIAKEMNVEIRISCNTQK